MLTLRVETRVLPEVLRLRGGMIEAGEVVAIEDAEEVDLRGAARILGVDYHTARRLIVVDKVIPHRRKTARATSSVLVRVSAIEAYKNASTVNRRQPPKRNRRTRPVTAADVLLGSI